LQEIKLRPRLRYSSHTSRAAANMERVHSRCDLCRAGENFPGARWRGGGAPIGWGPAPLTLALNSLRPKQSPRTHVKLHPSASSNIYAVNLPYVPSYRLAARCKVLN